MSAGMSPVAAFGDGDLGARLEAWRIDLGFSRQRVAKFLGVTRFRLADVVEGRAVVSQALAARIERVTGIVSQGSELSPWATSSQ